MSINLTKYNIMENNFNRKKHWEDIYLTKSQNKFGWFQPVPKTSLELFQKFQLPISAKIIDIGGGDGFFVDNLLSLGYEDITVLDISEAAIERAKIRLGENAKNVKWIIADISTYEPTEKYDFWHDRAAFHFLTQEGEVAHYVKIINQSINNEGVFVIGTFSENGPKKCSGIEIQQYSEESLSNLFMDNFQRINCFNIDHITPFETCQNFIFCSFKKKA